MINAGVLFEDRFDAAKKLCEALPLDKMRLEEWIVLATSANGVPIAIEVAKQLNSAIDFILTEKIFAPLNHECEVAIVTEKKDVVVHEEIVKAFDIDLNFIYDQAEILNKNALQLYVKKYRDGLSLPDLYDKNVLLVDEGLNTGLTMMACIKTAINMNAKSVSVAVPVLATATVMNIESIADDLYCPYVLEHFVSIDFYYKKLNELTFDEAKKILKKD